MHAWGEVNNNQDVHWQRAPTLNGHQHLKGEDCQHLGSRGSGNQQYMVVTVTSMKSIAVTIVEVGITVSIAYNDSDR
jgi:hypothetical protein